jgi:hypothetical protein
VKKAEGQKQLAVNKSFINKTACSRDSIQGVPLVKKRSPETNNSLFYGL